MVPIQTLERVLIVGLGSIGRRHARIARQLLPDAQIVALRHRAADDNLPDGVNRCVTTVEEAVRFAPQAAVIACPSPMHLDVAMPLAHASAHLLVEKPIAAATHGVAELVSACESRSLTLMTGYNLRYAPSLQRFRELLEKREVGRVLSVRAEVGQFLPSWRPATDYRITVSARAALGGGVLLELSHEIDYLRWLFGEVESVSATLSRQSDLEIDVEDTAHVVMRFAGSGVIGPLATLNMDFVRHDATRTCTVIGDAGTLRWNGIAGTIEKLEPGVAAWQTRFEHAGDRDSTYVAEWRDFMLCIATGGSPLVSGRDGLAALKVIEASRRSAASKSAVSLASDAAVSSAAPA